jgi:hypothetical protein
MTRSPRARSGDVEFDAFGAVAFFSSGRLTSINGTVRTIFCSPMTGKVVSFDLNIDTAFTNAAARANMGTLADAQNDNLLDDFVITNLTGYQSHVIGSALWVSKTIDKGQLYGLGFTNADATGLGTMTVGIAPVQAP